MAESIQINVEEEAHSSHKVQGRADHFCHKVASMERAILITNFILELPAAVFDQLSSKDKPLYALLSMLMSFTVLFISIIDLVYKGKKGQVSLMQKGLIPWFYYPYPISKPFGTFADIVGLFCGIFQCVFVSIAYAFLSRNADNPINLSVWPIVFAFGLLYCRLYGHHADSRPTSARWKLKRAEEFTLAQLAAATKYFSLQNRIGYGSFGPVYRGKLPDGREVVIKRIEKEFSKQIESEFKSELENLSRIHHKHLNTLVGFCADGDEKLLVYDYMKNGGLCDHLHHNNNIQKNSSAINSWKMRIKIALDAARGIEYLHNYAVPPIIHRDIKPSNILLDGDWTARVSNFALSLMGPTSDRHKMSTKVIGTVGYVDPECVDLNEFTAKVDVYSFGVVLLEILTGKKAIFKDDENEGRPTSVVDFAIPGILSGEWMKVLDSRVGPPELNEAEAVELVAYTAIHCVNLEGRNRPTMTDVVANLERSLSLYRCDSSSSVEDEPFTDTGKCRCLAAD